MARQQPISSGDILLDSRSIQDWQSREFAKRVAYLPQHLPQATNMTAKELIAMGRYAWNGACLGVKPKRTSKPLRVR